MTRISPDLSFKRDGVSLGDWLWRLLDEDRNRRQIAGDALQAMIYGLPSIHTDFEDLTELPDFDAQTARFSAEVRNIVSRSSFDTGEFVRRLIAYQLALQNDWLERCRIEGERQAKLDERFDRLVEPLRDRLEAAEDDHEKARAKHQLQRAIVAYSHVSCDPQADPFAGAETTSAAALAARHVFESLGRDLLAAPEALAEMLFHRHLRRDAHTALTRIGPPALSFAPGLIARIDRLDDADEVRRGGLRFDGAEALGAIGCGDAKTVDAMIQRLGSEEPAIRAAAAQVLQRMGTDVCDREAEIVERLWPMTKRHRERWHAVPALASVGRHFPEVRRFLRQRARAKPPRMRSPESLPNYRYDDAMVERGEAISAMVYLSDYAEECVGVLVEAIDDFEEYDSDEQDGGPLGRIAAVLGCFGTRAAVAAPALAAHLTDASDEPPRNILEALAAMGSSATGVLPQLESVRSRFALDEPLSALDAGPLDPHDDPVGWAMQQIRGTEQTALRGGQK